MEPQIRIKAEQLDESARILRTFLGDEFVLYGKTRIARWNVDGPDFEEKQKFFEEQYKQLGEIMNTVAERIRTLGHYAPFTVESCIEHSFLTEQEWKKTDSSEFIKDLLHDHESIIIRLKPYINIFANTLNDLETSHFATGLMETHEKMTWMLRAQLKNNLSCKVPF